MTLTTRKILVASTLLLIGLASPVFGAGVNVKHADADYETWKTWSYIGNPERLAALEAAGNSAIGTRIRQAITKRLSDRGYSQAKEGEVADFRVAIDGNMREVFDVQDYHKQVSDHVAFVLEGGSSSYQEGTLLIRILEGDGEKVVWTGWVTEEIRNPDKPGRQIDRVVKRILKRFPPSEP